MKSQIIHYKSLITLTAVGSFMLLTHLSSCQSNKQEKPNVLFISVDDLRPALGCYGDPLAMTPNIDQLADQGVTFTRHYVQAPSSAPSRTSMLTGLRPDQVEVTNHKTHFRETRPEAITLPQVFKNDGYRTVSIGKIFHYKQGYNDSHSWNEEHFLQGSEKSFKYVLAENKNTRGKGNSTEFVDASDTIYQDGQMAEMAMEYLASFKKNDTPFFLGLGFLKPHLPFTAPKKYWDMHERDDFGDIPSSGRPKNAPEIAFHNWQELRGYKDIPDKGPLTVEKEKQLRHGYYACVSYIDALVGKVLDKLDELGLRKNTIVVLWGDHGFHLGEQDLWAKSTNFELSAHSPLIISTPGTGKTGTTCDAVVESVDIYPTIVDVAGYQTKQELSGNSLKPLLIDPEGEWENMAFNQFARPYKAAIGAKKPISHMGYSVTVEGWRYTAWYNFHTGSFEYPELYSLEKFAVPFEKTAIPTVNLAGEPEYAEIESKLHKMIEQYSLCDQKTVWHQAD